MTPEHARNMEIPTDIEALLIASDWIGKSEWQSAFTKVFREFGSLQICGLHEAAKPVDSSGDIEVVFVACGGKENKGTLYPALREKFKGALIIAIPYWFPQLSQVRDYFKGCQSGGTNFVDDVWRVCFDPNVIKSNFLTELAGAVAKERKRKESLKSTS